MQMESIKDQVEEILKIKGTAHSQLPHIATYVVCYFL